jgi:hypothetical protein
MAKTFFSGCRHGMHLFGQNIAIIINTMLLVVVYAIGVGLTSIVAKISGKHFLEMKRHECTYWKDLNLKKKELNEYHKQF